MDDIGTYKECAFPAHRNPTIDVLEIGRRRHHIPVLFEADVTVARERLGRIKVETGEGLSFTAWVMACVGRAVGEHKHVQAMRKGRGGLVIFDDVDISVLVERKVERDDRRDETLPMPYVVRGADRKSVPDIHAEIRAAQGARVGKGEVQIAAPRRERATRIFAGLPRFLRNMLFWRRVSRDPFLAKRSMGTVVVTSTGALGMGGGAAWAIPAGIHPVIVAVGAIARKPGVVGDAIQVREILSVTVLFDHDVTDGAPVARFIRRFRELLEAGHGLSEGAEG